MEGFIWNNVNFANLNQEQLQLLTDLESKLNATLIAYESSLKRRTMEEIAMEKLPQFIFLINLNLNIGVFFIPR